MPILRHLPRVGIGFALGIVLAVAGVARAADAQAPEAAALLPGNMISNPSFEYDYHNNHAKGHVLGFMEDYAFNASDLKPDYWAPTGHWQWIEGIAHTGTHCLLLGPGASVGRAVLKAAVNAQVGGGDTRWMTPGAVPINYDHPERLARTVRAAVWYKSDNLGGNNRLTIEVSSCNVSKSASAATPTKDWQRLEVELTRAEIERAYATGKAKGVEALIGLTIRSAGQAKVYIDDVSLAEEQTEPNLAINPGFEDVDAQTGLPAGWSTPLKYRVYTNHYYKWTSWHHFFGPIRGPVTTTDLVAHSGKRSLLMQVYPGDEMAVEGAPVVLNQKVPGIIEVGAYVMLDRLKWIDIRAVDQDGNPVPCTDAFTGGQPVPQDTAQWYPSNAHEWVYVRKTFFSPKPLASIRPRLCARGFNGDTRDDSGSRPNVNQVGLAWWDDVRVCEVTATDAELRERGVKFASADTGQKPGATAEGVTIASLDLGERLFGDNRATFVLANNSSQAAHAMVSLSVLGNDGQSGPVTANQADIPAGGTASIQLGYHLGPAEMRPVWTEQGHFRLSLTVAGQTRTAVLAYNTWPVTVKIEMGRNYALPTENPQHVAINLGVGAGTLAKTKTLLIETCARRDAKAVNTIRIDDLAKALSDTRANYENLPKRDFDTPNPLSWADCKNLLAIDLDLSKLPVHPYNDPVRDYFLRVRGLDGSGQELFSDVSQPFGRVEPNTEVLPKITSTQVREDGAVMINGKPVFVMAGNFYTTLHYALHASQVKLQGYNCVRWVEGVGAAAANWRSNLYSLETMVHLPQMTKANLEKWQAAGDLDGVVTLASDYESGLLAGTPQAPRKEYTQLAHSVAHRISNFGGGGAHSIYTLEGAFGAYDSIGVEIEPFGPPRGGFEMAPWLRQGHHAWFHLPQTYSTTPFDSFRFDQYAVILQGGRGFSSIHGLSDPSLMRGITGEVRHLSPAIFSLDAGDSRTAVSPDIWWMQKKVGPTTTLIALSKPAVEIGQWTWHDDATAPDGRSHTGISEFEPWRTPDGLRLHGFREAKPVMIQKGDRLVQSVWLDPSAMPVAIAWGARGDAKWDFNAHYGKAFDFAKWRDQFVNYWLGGELLPGTWELGWQYNDATKNWFADHILNASSFKVHGDLPAPGKWVTLEISADAAGLVGKQVDGFFFIAQGGQAAWAHSAIVRGGKEIVLCGKSLGPSRDDLADVHVAVPWAPDGTKVKVDFEERNLVVKNGMFTDDFRGVDFYQTIRGGALGDAVGWQKPGTALKAQTIGYVTPRAPTCVHIYEITPGQ